MARLGQLLVEANKVTENNLARALGVQHFAGGRLGTLLLERGSVDEDALGNMLAAQHGCEYVPWRVLADIAAVTIAALPGKFAIKHAAVPYERGENYLKLALRDPGDLRILDELFFVTGRKIFAGVCPEVRIYQALEKYYGERRTPRFVILADKLTRQLRVSRGQGAPPPPPPEFFPNVARKPARAPAPQEIWGEPAEPDLGSSPIIESWKIPDQISGGWAGTASPGMKPETASAPESISWEELPAIPSLWVQEPLAPPAETPRAESSAATPAPSPLAPPPPQQPPPAEPPAAPVAAPSPSMFTPQAPPEDKVQPQPQPQPPKPQAKPPATAPVPMSVPVPAPVPVPVAVLQPVPVAPDTAAVPAQAAPEEPPPPVRAPVAPPAAAAVVMPLPPEPPPVPIQPASILGGQAAAGKAVREPVPASPAAAPPVAPPPLPPPLLLAPPPPPRPASPLDPAFTAAAPPTRTPVLPLPTQTDFPEVAQSTDRDSIATAALAALGRRFDRGAIFAARPDAVAAWGVTGDVDMERFRLIEIPWNEPSVFLNVRYSRTFYLGPLPPLPRHAPFARIMGGWPEECVVYPVMLRDRPVAFLYAEFSQDRGATPMDLAYLRELAAASSNAFASAIRLRKREL